MTPGRSVRAVPTEGTGKREPTTSAKAEVRRAEWRARNAPAPIPAEGLAEIGRTFGRRTAGKAGRRADVAIADRDLIEFDVRIGVEP